MLGRMVPSERVQRVRKCARAKAGQAGEVDTSPVLAETDIRRRWSRRSRAGLQADVEVGGWMDGWLGWHGMGSVSYMTKMYCLVCISEAAARTETKAAG